MKFLSLPALALLLVSAGCSKSPSFQRPLPAVTSVREPAFRQGTGALLSASFVAGNRIETLNNGREIYPAMLRAIAQARRTVHFETFVFANGEVPREFAEALATKAREGVEVRLILDAVGAGKSRRYHPDLRAAGVRLEVFHRAWWPDPRRYNHRTHRKLLIVDGRVGFIGGVGIADFWAGEARSPEEWRETHYRVEGPVVAQLQGAFADNWMRAHGEVLQGDAHFPPLSVRGSAAASVFHSSPQRQRHGAELMYHLAVASARRSVRIITPYFLPGTELTDALCQASRRGVKVQILLPGKHMDQALVRLASRKRWPRLLEASVELYEYEPTMIHAKLLVVDDYFVSVGSANLDPRSLRINDEANLNVLDQTFAREQSAVFQRDLRKSRRVTGKFRAAQLAEFPLQTLQTPIESQL